jgi:hypothetical protein
LCQLVQAVQEWAQTDLRKTAGLAVAVAVATLQLLVLAVQV